MDDFTTTVHNDYLWPCLKPLVPKPAHPPLPDSAPRPRPPPVSPYCHCDGATYLPRIEQLKQLLDKERKLCMDYEHLKKRMADVYDDIQNHSGEGGDSALTTIYRSSYHKRTFPIVDYNKIVSVAHYEDLPPLESNREALMHCFHDPTTFHDKYRYVPPPPEPGEKRLVEFWLKEYPGKTEYMDAYCESAVECWNAMQNRNPLPSMRRKPTDTC